MRFAADYSETLDVFFDPIQIPLSPDKYTVCPQIPLGVLKNYVLCSTLCIVERGSNNSREARRVDFVGLRTNDAHTDCFHTFFLIRILSL
jgi:hypothetical protein